MKIIKQTVFEGQNIYSHKKCIRLDVDLCGYAEVPSKSIEGFNEGLVKFLPELKKHRCGIDEEGGFLKRLEEGTYLAHICEHTIIAIQNTLGVDVCYGKAREIEKDLYYIIVEYKYKRFALESVRLAIDIINSLINKESINFEKRMNMLNQILSVESIGPSTKAIKDAAQRYGMPFFSLGDTGFYQIGYGKQGRVIEATIGAQTSCVATDIASDKQLTKDLLRNQNIPVSDGREVHNVIELLQEGERIGYPLVLKPRYGNKGKGVVLNIQDEKTLIKAYKEVKEEYGDVIIENYIEGNDYRVCVVDYNVVAVSLREPPYVVGDGVHTIKELITIINKDKLRGYDHEKPLTKIKIDEELVSYLENKNLSLNSKLKPNERVNLRDNANLSTGGMAIDCTGKISKENKKICVRAAKAIGLDICGIDIKIDDIGNSILEKGKIMEVNAAPGIRMHMYPSKGKKRDVGEAILSLQYGGIPFNIPVISITGTNGKTTTTRLTYHVLSNMGYKVGMTTTDGIFIDGEYVDIGDDTGYDSAKTVLLNKDVEVAVLETARGGLIRKGLAYEAADVAAITNITEDHIGIDGVNNMEELAYVKSLVGEAVKDDGYVVLNADDKWTKTILKNIKAKRIFFSKNKDNVLIQEAISKGEIAVYIENDMLMVSNENKKYKVSNIKRIPITLNGVLEFNIENILAACAILVGMGVDYCMISKGFRSFRLDNKLNSGRFNIHNINGVKVILDYGHNIEGYKSVLKSVDKLEYNKLIGVIGVPGDRKNDVISKIGKVCAEFFDEIYIKEDKDKRGRKTGEVAEVLRDSISEYSEVKEKIVLDEKEALSQALESAKAGDYIIVFYEDLDSLLKVLKDYKNFKENKNLANL